MEMEMEMDRLSALPNSLHLLILRRLDMKEAARTAVLSKQWRFVWADWMLRFWDRSEKMKDTRSFVASVHAVLALSVGRGSTPNTLYVSFYYYNRFTCDVDSWLEFAVKNEIKDIQLDLKPHIYTDCDHLNIFNWRDVTRADYYTLPQMMYFNSSLTRLYLKYCIMNPSEAVQWRSMTMLSIRHVKLPQEAIENILSGCPVLETLVLDACWGFKRLEASFRVLRLHNYPRSELLEISAPYMHTLCVNNFPVLRAKLRLTNVPSLQRAKIDFFSPDWEEISEELMTDTMQLFQDLRNANTLVLQSSCTKVLTKMAIHGRRLPLSRLEDLKIEVESDARSICGIVALLESSPQLRAVRICGCLPKEDEFINFDPTMIFDLNHDLLHLKVVRIRDFIEPYLSGEPTITLSQMLLKRAPNLENIVIHKTTFLSEVVTNDLIKIFQTLLIYPKSSRKAVVKILQ